MLSNRVLFSRVNCLWNDVLVEEVPNVLVHVAAERKGFYDLHGEEPLKNARHDANGLVKGGIYQFNPSRCEEIFSTFFGTTNPFEALEGVMATRLQRLSWRSSWRKLQPWQPAWMGAACFFIYSRRQ